MNAVDKLAISVLSLAVVTSAAALGLHWYGGARYDAGHAAAVSEQQEASLVATVGRVQENAIDKSKQQSINLNITEVKNAEIIPVRDHIAADRVRIGAASCGAGPAITPDPASSSGGDGANPPGRLVRDDVERDTRALTMAVEEDLATGRACQAFVRDNGLVP